MMGRRDLSLVLTERGPMARHCRLLHRRLHLLFRRRVRHHHLGETLALKTDIKTGKPIAEVDLLFLCPKIGPDTDRVQGLCLVTDG